MPSGFVHSVKVPRLYKSATRIVREVRENGGSLKSLIYEQKHPNVSALYALCLNALQREDHLNELLSKTNLLKNESRLDPWLAKILITELIWGKQALKSECKPVQTVLAYEQKLKEELSTIKDDQPTEINIKAVKKARYVRINTLLVPLIKGISYFQEEGWSLVPRCSSYVEHLDAVKTLEKPKFIQDFHVQELLVFPPDTTFHDHPGYQNGELILQDKASCLPSHLLKPEVGSAVLDMCAAPGMKSTHLAALLKNTGKVYAVEIDERRYETLCEQVKRTGASCVETCHKDALTLDAKDYSNVEYILVDPTCSGSGMLDRQAVHGKEVYDPRRLKQLQAFQVFLLRSALLSFPKVKRVVYSTCSVNPEENEEVIDEILGNVQEAYKLVPVKKLLHEEWLNYSSNLFKCGDKCLYAYPDVDLCNGFFVAVFERNFDVSLPEYKRKKNSTSNNDEGAKLEHGENSRKRKKRGKRKGANPEAQKAEETENEEIKDSVAANVSSHSNWIVEEVGNDLSRNEKEVKVSRENSGENSEKDDGEPVKKKKRKKQQKLAEIPGGKLRLSIGQKKLKSQKKKRQTL